MRTALPLIEAAHEIGVSLPQIRRLISRGELPHARVGRRVLVLSDDLARFLLARRVPATPTGKANVASSVAAKS